VLQFMRRASLGRYRAGLVGGCVLALVVAVAVVWGATRPRVPDPASLPLPAPRFVAEDGTTYTRVAVAYLDTSKSSSVEVDVPPGSTPLSVYPACALARPGSDDMSGIVVGSATANSSFACLSRATFGLEVVDLDRSALIAGGRLRFTRADTLADAPATAPAAWAFGVYAWTMPASLAPAPAAPPVATTVTVPGTTRRLTLLHEYHGVWPVQRTARITVPGGKGFVVAFACSSSIAGKTITFIGANQQLVDMGSVTCGVPGGPGVNSYAHVYTDQPTTATITLNFDPIFNRRGGSWTVAVYRP
jgi:hypothetical protein